MNSQNSIQRTTRRRTSVRRTASTRLRWVYVQVTGTTRKRIFQRHANSICLVLLSVATLLFGVCNPVSAGKQTWFVDFFDQEEQMSCDSVVLRNSRLIFPFFGETMTFRMEEDSAGDVWIRGGFHYPHADLLPDSGELIVRFAIIVNDNAREGLDPPILGRSEPRYFVRGTNTTMNYLEILHDVENAFRVSEITGPLILVTGSYVFSPDVYPGLADRYDPESSDGTVWLEAEYRLFTRASALDVFGARPTHTCFRTIPGLALVDVAE